MLQWMGKTYAPKGIQATLIVFTECSFLFLFFVYVYLCACACTCSGMCVHVCIHVCVHMCFSPTCISAPPACLVAVEA